MFFTAFYFKKIGIKKIGIKNRKLGSGALTCDFFNG